MLNVFGGIFYFLISLGVLVTIHEFGHFITARLCGVKVLRFSVGFGPILWKKTAKNGCEYAISAIPLGGYVKMEGENTPTTDKSKLAPDSFKAQSVFKRALIIAAGPVFNIVLAIIVYTMINLHGVNERLPIVGFVVPNTIAQNSGLKEFDRIDVIDGKKIESYQDVIYTLVGLIGSDTNARFEVKGNLGQDEPRTLTMNLKDLVLEKNADPLNTVGFFPCYGKVSNEIAAVQAGSPAEDAQIKIGDKILSINDKETKNWFEIHYEITMSKFEDLHVVIERDGQKYSTVVKPTAKHDEARNKDIPFVGIGPKLEIMQGLTRKVEYDFVGAVGKAFDDAYQMSKVVVVSSYKLLSGSISAKNISGPIAIAKGAQESASYGLFIFLGFLAAISVNLGILNLLPIPVLDGGQLLFLAYEALMRREPSARAQMVLTSCGAAVLLTLMLFAVFNDLQGLQIFLM